MANAQDWIDLFKSEEPEKAAAAEAILDHCQRVADALKKARLDRGLNRDAIAQKLELSPTRISQIEGGSPRYTPNNKLIARWAHACDLTFALIPMPQVSQATLSGVLEKHRGFVEAGAVFIEDVAASKHLSAKEGMVNFMVEDVMYAVAASSLSDATGGTLGRTTAEDRPRRKIKIRKRPHSGKQKQID